MEGNIRMDIKEIGWEGVEGMYLAQHRDLWQVLLNIVMKILVP
jgi:hypothetical protein